MSGVYRDRLEQCPRCGVDLISTGSMRRCPDCSGHWVPGEVLRELMEAMLVPPRPVALELEAVWGRQALPCPSCEQRMETWNLHGVPIDRCEQHGLWFDRAELERVLFVTSGLAPEQPAQRSRATGELEALAAVLERDS